MHKIDNIDIQIVNILMYDGRLPCPDIARQIGNITERAVRYRINRLVDAGIIKTARSPTR